MLDAASLTQPLSDDDPCGPDLDFAGDPQYLNFFAGAESLLPMSYFDVVNASGERGRFDPKSIDFGAQFAAAKPLLARTRDLRLLVLLAKFSILDRDLDGFLNCLKAISSLLTTQWDGVHPRGEDGDYAFRAVTIEAIDVFPTVINPLQFLPLIENRRHGTLNYRAYQIAKGEIQAGADGDSPDIGTIDRIVADTDLDALKTIGSRFSELAAALGAIKAAWHDRLNSGLPLSLDKLSGVVSGITTWLSALIAARDPGLATPAAATETAVAPDAAAAMPAGAIASTGAAAAALSAVAGYFARAEPSSPALLLVRQAEEMVGKSFVEVMRILVPAHIEAAAINIGRDKVFDLPIERMAALVTEGDAAPAAEAQTQELVFPVENRAQALALLGQVATFFRTAEPSSPIPFLIDRARDLAQRDFLSLLHDVLPEGALKTIERSH